MTQSADLSRLSDSLPTDTSKQYVWQPGTGWVQFATGGSSLTKANFKTKVLAGALGYGGSSNLWHDSTLGTVARLASYDSGVAVQGSTVGPSIFQYLTATSGIVPANYIYDGATQLRISGTAATITKLSASDTTLVFNTGSTAAGSMTLANRTSLNPNMSHSSAGIATSRAWMTVRIPTIATAAQDLQFQITLPTGYNDVIITHQFAVSSNTMIIQYNNAAGSTQTATTSFTPAAATLYEFWAALDTINLTVGYTVAAGTSTTLLTVARTALQVDQPFLGPTLVAAKKVGTTALTFQVRDFGMEIALT